MFLITLLSRVDKEKIIYLNQIVYRFIKNQIEICDVPIAILAERKATYNTIGPNRPASRNWLSPPKRYFYLVEPKHKSKKRSYKHF